MSSRTLSGMAKDPLRTARVVAGTAFGSILVGAGLVMLITPGPGLLAIAAGSAVLARHHPGVARLRTRWAARLRRATDGTGPASGAGATDPDPA